MRGWYFFALLGKERIGLFTMNRPILLKKIFLTT